jgi:predicted lipoprotein with Yx(FWY)xxD motif
MNSTLARRLSVPLACLAAALALAACGDDNGNETTAAATTGGSGTAPSASGNATVDVADSDLGQILVDADGRTLYLFEKDDKGDHSSCSGDCAKAWPPLTTEGSAEAGDGVDGAELTRFKREDGTLQVAYHDHPLSYFSGDSAPGDTTGQGSDAFGAEWYALDASGEAVEDEGSGSGEGESDDDSSSSGGGYSSY